LLKQESRLFHLFYQPKTHPMALLTRPVFLVGVLVPGTTLFSSCASLYAWVRGRMVLGVPRVEERLATLVFVQSRTLVLSLSNTLVSVQGEMPTMMLPPITLPFFPRALFACILVCILTWIQLELGWTTCWRTVPHTDSSERTKLRAEGGKPQTVIQVSRGEQSGEVATS